MISEISFLWRHTLVLYRCIESDYSSHALEVLILFFNLTVWTQKAKRAKRFHSLQYWLLRLTNRITDKWTVGYLSVHVFSTKVLIEDTIFTSHTGDAWDLHFMWSSKPRKGLAICSRAKAVSSFLSHIKNVRTGYWSGPGNETRDLPLSCQAPFRLSSLLASSPGRSSAREPRKTC